MTEVFAEATPNSSIQQWRQAAYVTVGRSKQRPTEAQTDGPKLSWEHADATAPTVGRCLRARNESIQFTVARSKLASPARIASGLAKVVFEIGDGLLVGIDLLLLVVDFRALIGQVALRIALLHALGRVRVVLNAQVA